MWSTWNVVESETDAFLYGDYIEFCFNKDRLSESCSHLWRWVLIYDKFEKKQDLWRLYTDCAF